MLKNIGFIITDLSAIEFLSEFTGFFEQVGNAVAKPDGSDITVFWFSQQNFLFDFISLADEMCQASLVLLI
jgi:hypothetical protein